jgi:hypothetical protein
MADMAAVVGLVSGLFDFCHVPLAPASGIVGVEPGWPATAGDGGRL